MDYTLLEDGEGFKGIAPFKGTEQSACWDLAIPKSVIIHARSTRTVPLLIAFDITESYCIEMYGRSSLLSKKGIIANTSIIDADYKKCVHAILYNTTDEKVTIYEGERIVQIKLVRLEDYDLTKVDYIEDTGRGGLGSTGK